MGSADEKTDLKEKRNFYDSLWISRSTLEKRLIVIAVVFLVFLLTIGILYITLLKMRMKTLLICCDAGTDGMDSSNVSFDSAHGENEGSDEHTMRENNFEGEIKYLKAMLQQKDETIKYMQELISSLKVQIDQKNIIDEYTKINNKAAQMAPSGDEAGNELQKRIPKESVPAQNEKSVNNEDNQDSERHCQPLTFAGALCTSRKVKTRAKQSQQQLLGGKYQNNSKKEENNLKFNPEEANPNAVTAVAEDPNNQWTKQKKRRQNKKPITGTSTKNSKLKVVPRKMSLYISRLSPETKANEVLEHINNFIPNGPRATCEQMQSKFPEHYSSFRIDVDESQFECASNPEQWPAETWCTQANIQCVGFPGFYRSSSFCRSEFRHGGVAIWCRDHLDSREVDLEKPEICTSSACLETSMELLNQIDIEQNPCHDFYKFSCGNFMRNTNLDRMRSRSAPDIMREEIQSRIKNILERPARSEETKYIKKAKEFYSACMNESAIENDGIKWMKQIFRKIGGWPTLQGEDWREDEFDWKKSLHELRRMGINFEFFITLSVEQDKKDPAKYVLQLNDPYKRHSRQIDDEVRNVYLRYMEDVAVYFGSTHGKARLDQKEVLNFTLELAKISAEGKRTNMSGLYDPHTLSELQYKFSSIHWYEFINGLLAPSAKLDYGDEILVPDPFYLMKFENLILNTNKRILANFIAWHTLQIFINFMPEDLVNKVYEYMEAVHGNVVKKPRWQKCVSTVKERMGPVISSAYIEQYFNENTRRQVTQMFHELKSRFTETLENFEWIDKPTRKVIRSKLLDIAADIASYDDIQSLLKTCDDFNEVVIYHDNLLLSVMNLEKFSLDSKYRKLNQPVIENPLEDPDFVTGLDISNKSSNVLVFPIGILNSIYFFQNRPKFYNYGGLGSLVSHKVWEIFTTEKYSEVGGKGRKWWTPTTLLNYEDRLKCLGGTFERMNSRKNSHNMSKAAEEDLGYLIGVKTAYNAYENWIDEHGQDPLLPGVKLTQKQLFWIYFVRPFCTKYVNLSMSSKGMKINGILSNLQEFADDFNCEDSDRMNLDQKCNIF